MELIVDLSHRRTARRNWMAHLLDQLPGLVAHVVWTRWNVFSTHSFFDVFCCSVLAPRQVASPGLEEAHGERKHVQGEAWVLDLTAQTLWRHPAAIGVTQRRRNAKVRHLGLAVSAHKEVGALEITVRHALGLKEEQSSASLSEELPERLTVCTIAEVLTEASIWSVFIDEAELLVDFA